MSAVAWAPGRVNIIGEHVDYNDGLVLPMAIHLGCLATASRRDDSLVRVTSAQHPGTSMEIPLDDLRPGKVQGWAAYAAGAAWSVTDGALACGLNISIDGMVPAGAGLSSSASVECSVALAVSALLDLHHPSRELARLAQRAENEFVGVPTGSMDQVASMLSVEGSALLFDVRDDTVRPIGLELPGMTWLVIDTGVHHALADGEYARRRATCEQAARILGVQSLRDVEDLDTAIDALAREPNGALLIARTRHVVTEIHRVHEAVAAIEQGDVDALGDAMNRSHASLRDDYEVSCPELDLAVEACRTAGAAGARMTGGGFGGSVIALVPVDRAPEVGLQVRARFAGAGWAEPTALEVSPGGGARLM